VKDTEIIGNAIERVYDDCVFDELREAIEAVEPVADERELAELLALRDRLDARIAERVDEVDRAELWRGDGSPSMTSWLKRHAGMTGKRARDCTRAGHLVGRCAAVREAWRSGRLAGGQVEAITANVTPPLLGLFTEHAEAVVGHVADLGVVDTAKAMQHWAVRAKIALALGNDLPDEPARTAFLSRLLQGRGRLDANLDAAAFEVVRTAMELAARPDAEGEERTPAERRADALVDICRFFLDHQKLRLGGRRRPHVDVIVDLLDLGDGTGGSTLDGHPLDPATIKTVLCDANVHRVVTDGASSILDYGRATRTIAPAVFTSLVLRDSGCRFPGCDRPPEWTEGHHVVPWESGGPTRLDNLVLLCWHHHHLIHQRGWNLKLLPSATVEVTRPDGRVMTSEPPGKAMPTHLWSEDRAPLPV
jgi:hypothetical protein